MLSKERQRAGAHLGALKAVQDPQRTGRPQYLDVRA
jgi:hypothetical protein